MPALTSPPMEPYIKRSSAVLKGGCGTTRKNLYQPNHAPNARTTRSTTSVIRSVRVLSGVHAIMRHSPQNVFMYSTIASLSADGSFAPKVWGSEERRGGEEGG